MIAMLSSWRHSGFHVFCGNRISPHDETAMENLARYITGIHEDHQLHRRPGSDQDHPQALGAPACQIKTNTPRTGCTSPIVHVMDGFSQLPMNDDHLYRDPEYPWDDYIQS